MKVEIWSDIACPWCAVGKRRFRDALAAFEHRGEVEVRWHSFELDPSAPRVHAEPQPELLARKYGVSLADAQTMNARMSAEAEREDLPAFHLERCRVGNTFDAHRLIHHAAREAKQDAMIDRLFRAYLSEGEALGDHQTLASLAGEVGLDETSARAMLASGEFATQVRADEARAHELGINSVPFFAIDEQVGISGAQPAALLLDALRQVRTQSASPSDRASEAGLSCDDHDCDLDRS